MNKRDNVETEDEGLWEYYSLGLGEPRPISALHGYGTGDLLDDVVALLPPEDDEEEPEDDGLLSVAIIGRPNAGKSSLFNRICGEERTIVSDVAGTTRDAIDTIVEHDGVRYRMVDTAGIRKKSTVYEDVEYYSLVRGLRAIDRSDVALLVIDSSIGVTEQDQKVANMAIERGCALVILLNKWDLLTEDYQRAHIMEDLARRFTLAPWAEHLCISALTGRSVDDIWKLIDRAADHRAQRIPTAALNRMLDQIREAGYTVSEGRRRLKMYYVTQTGVNPPVFTFFVNYNDLVNDNFKRYLENRIRNTFDLTGTPIRLQFRRREPRE